MFLNQRKHILNDRLKDVLFQFCSGQYQVTIIDTDRLRILQVVKAAVGGELQELILESVKLRLDHVGKGVDKVGDDVSGEVGGVVSKLFLEESAHVAVEEDGATGSTVSLGDLGQTTSSTGDGDFKDDEIDGSTTGITDHESVTVAEIKLVALALAVEGGGFGLGDEHESVRVIGVLDQFGLDGSLSHDVLGSVRPHGRDGQTVAEVVALKVFGEPTHDLADDIFMEGVEVVGDGLEDGNVDVEGGRLLILVEVEFILVEEGVVSGGGL